MNIPLIEKFESLLGTKKIPSLREKELFKKTQDFVRFIQWIPGLQMVAVSNSLAMFATHKESDIDLFIITAPKRLWIVRTLVLFTAELLGVRVKPQKEAGRFCFPFFMTEKNLSFKGIALENDVYLAYWIRSLKPVYNQYYTYGRFMEVNQALYEDILQIDPSGEERATLLRENRSFLTLTRRDESARKIGLYFSQILSFTDTVFGFFSKKHLAKKINTGDTEGIIVNDNMVKLHLQDRRREINDQIMYSNGEPLELLTE